MADTILIYIPAVDAQVAAWAAVDNANGALHDSGESPLEDIASHAAGKRVVIALSGSELLITRAKVPGSNTAKATRAVPFALEEQLAEDIESLHFALGPRAADGSFPVAVIARDKLSSLLANCERAGLHPQSVLLAPLLLPSAEDEHGRAQWAATSDGQHVELRNGELSGFGVECSLFDTLMPMALAEAGDAAPNTLRLFANDAGRAALPPQRLEMDEQAVASPLEVFAKGLKQPQIDLLQGDYSRRQQAGKLWKPWRLSAALVALWLAVVGTQSFIEHQRLGSESERLEAQISELLREAFPDIKRVVNPQSQMRARLRKLRQGGGGGGNFVNTLSVVAKALGQSRGTTLQSVAFRAGRMELDLEADKLQSLDQLKQSLEKSGQLTATIQSANQEQGKVRGRLRLEAKS